MLDNQKKDIYIYMILFNTFVFGFFYVCASVSAYLPTCNSCFPSLCDSKRSSFSSSVFFITLLIGCEKENSSMRFWMTQRYQFLEIFFFEFWLLDEEADKRLCVGSFVHVKKKNVPNLENQYMGFEGLSQGFLSFYIFRWRMHHLGHGNSFFFFRFSLYPDA